MKQVRTFTQLNKELKSTNKKVPMMLRRFQSNPDGKHNILVLGLK